MHDYRIKHISLTNFRKFPYSEIPYGLQTSIDGKPVSTLLYGGNGCGKSSFYDALQLMFTGIMTNNPQKQPHYGGDESLKLSVKVTTVNDMFTWVGSAKEVGGKDNTANTIPLNIKSMLPAFFCSEEDILSISNNNPLMLNEYLYGQIGYGSSYRFYKLLNALHQKVRGDKRYDVDKLKESEALRIERENRLTKLLIKIELKESSLRDTFQSLELLHKVDQTKMKSLLDSLHKDIVFSYDDSRDNIGKMYERQARFDELNAELKNIISQLEGEKKRFCDETMISYKFLNDLYDSIINKLKSACYDTCKIKGQKYAIMSTCYERMNNLKHDITHINETFRYHISRMRAINNCKRDNTSIGEFYFQEVSELKEMYDEKSLLNGEKQAEEQFRKHLALDPYLFRFMKEFRRILGERINSILSPMKDTIETILRDFDMDGDSVTVNYNEDKNELNILYKMENSDGNTVATFSPSQYLNSFRLKTYCITVKVALVFAIMRAYNFVFPLVFDDVIFACDFNNRSGVKQFIGHILECYKRQCSSLAEMQPLQLIFFTHDDVVFNAAADAFDDCSKRVVGRMFDYRDADGGDTIEGDNNIFYNLYVRK